ncbi:MAG: alkaline phosphatase D family protein [Luteibaculum sp.]
MKTFTLFVLLMASFLSFAQDNFTKREVFNAQADERLAPFYHGVASGDPLSDRVIIWTRYTPESEAPVQVNWIVARDLNLEQVVQSGTFTTDANRDYTVKVDVSGLSPNTTYYYAFRVNGKQSITGRTRTAPSGDTDFVRLGVVSCADYQNGYFNAFRHLAERKDLNAVLHLGDYLYEYGARGGERSHVPETEMIDLAEYRARHSHYKLDPDLRAAHQQNPWIMVWDDHETTNNSYKNGAQNHTEGAEGDWETRKQVALKAYYEWQPIRVPDEQNNFTRIWRKIAFGNLLDIIMLDTRLYGRDEQTATAVITDTELNDPNRQMLGADQLSFVNTAVINSKATWKVLGQQVMMTQLNVLGLPLVEDIPVLGESLLEVVKDGGIAINGDAWDGYPQERKRVLKNIADNNINNTVVLTGDIHTSWAADLHWDISNPSIYNPITGGSVAVEFVTPSITSGNGDAVDPTGGQVGQVIHPALMAANPHIKYVDFFSHGYMVLDMDKDRAQCDWFFVNNIASPESEESYGAGFLTRKDENFVRRASGESNRGNTGADLAPVFGRVTSISERNKDAVILGAYPNPAQDRLQVNYVSNIDGEYSLLVLDQSGKTILKQELPGIKAGFGSAVLDLSPVQPGLYFLQIKGQEQSKTLRFVKR